jgi:ubiquinone/menaquinone biosynthesis C-methylase UbiE
MSPKLAAMFLKIWGLTKRNPLTTMSKARTSTTDSIVFVEGSAEAIPIETATIDIITAVQSDRQDFYAESNRIMAVGGTIAIYKNNRSSVLIEVRNVGSNTEGLVNIDFVTCLHAAK